MSLIRYQSPELSTWPVVRSLGRSPRRDEQPFRSANDGQFCPASAALQRLDAGSRPVSEQRQRRRCRRAPGMRKEDIDISLHDGMLTIAGERQSSVGRRRKCRTHRAFQRQIPPQHHPADASRRGQSQRLLQRWHPDRHAPESGGSEAKESRSHHRIITVGGPTFAGTIQERKSMTNNLVRENNGRAASRRETREVHHSAGERQRNRRRLHCWSSRCLG